MRTIKYISAIAIAAGLSFSASSYAKEEKTFKHEGVTYTYTVEQVGSRQHVKGRAYPNGEQFSLYIQDNSVSGRYNGSAVRFDVPDAQTVKAEAGQEIASR